MFENIPQELRNYNSWVLWALEDSETGRPTKVPYSPSGYHAKSTDPNTWTTFDNAVNLARSRSDKWAGIGFVLSANDPFAFIDLDEPKNPDGSPVSDEEYKIRMDRQHMVYNEFNSYAELSPSGKGLHIIVKGSIPSGRKRSSVEIYSDMRFMTMTGNVYRNAPIADYNELINNLWAEIGKGQAANTIYAGLDKASMTDDEVIQTAINASNSEKFGELFYTSHSNIEP